MISSLKIALVLAMMPLVSGLVSAQSDTIPDDKAHRDMTMHWPDRWQPGIAPVFSHNELLMHADCHRVWTQFVDVTRWPDWLVFVKDVTIASPGKKVEQGAVLHLRIFGTPITTRLDEFVPESRVGWTPKGDQEAQPRHYHNWHFVPQGSGCLVITEESGIGPDDIKDPQANSRFMHRAHDLWLASLKWASES